MGKFNLSEAAKDILQGTVDGKRSGQDKPSKLDAGVVGDAGDIGTEVTKTTDAAPQATKGAPTATAPGATPPVGSEPIKKLKGQPAQSGSVEQPEGKSGGQTFQRNAGAADIKIPEETEHTEDALAEEKEAKESAAHERKEALKTKMKEKMKEDMSALLDGEELSEEFVTKATTIFEAAVISRAEAVIEEAEAELIQQFEEAIEIVKEDLAAKVDDYLNYMVEEWLKENEIAIEKGLRSEIVEDFITGLKGLFEQHYIDIPTEKVDVVEGLTAKVEELEASLNEQINRAVEMKKELNEHKKNEAIYTACEGLSQTQVEKMKSLAEGVDFTTEDEFNGKLETLKESYFKASVKTADNSALDDEVQLDEETKKPSGQGDALIESYAKTISQTLVK